MDINRLSGVLFNLFPQSPDMYIHSPYIPRVIIAPDDVQKIFSAVYLIRMKGQKLQQVILLGRQPYFLPSVKTRLLSQSILRPFFSRIFFLSSSVVFLVLLRIIALILAFTSRILNGLVI